MTGEERQLLETAAEYRALVSEMIERALFASQRLRAEIQSGNPNAFETAKDVENRLGVILQWWMRLGGNTVNLSS